MQGPGGTSGGIVPFCGGCALVGVGLYTLFSRVMVHSGGMFHGYFGTRYGAGTSIGGTVGLFVAAIAVLFFNGRSRIGWGMVALSLLLLAFELISSLQMNLRPTPLPALLLMVGSIGAGIGLIARSFRAQ